MQIFISWSGERSRAVAQALSKWLGECMDDLHIWLSDKDIGGGQRWSERIAEALSSSSLALLCVTSDNVRSPWLNFEAGAVAHHFQTKGVIPLLWEMSMQELSGPLQQFQARMCDASGMREFLKDVNRVLDRAMSDANLEKRFERYWPDLEADFSRVQRLVAVDERNSEALAGNAIAENGLVDVRNDLAEIKILLRTASRPDLSLEQQGTLVDLADSARKLDQRLEVIANVDVAGASARSPVFGQQRARARVDNESVSGFVGAERERIRNNPIPAVVIDGAQTLASTDRWRSAVEEVLRRPPFTLSRESRRALDNMTDSLIPLLQDGQLTSTVELIVNSKKATFSREQANAIASGISRAYLNME